MEKHLLVLRCFAVLALVSACGAEPPPPAEYPPVEEPPAPAVEPPAAVIAVEEAPPPPPVQVVAGESTPLEGAAPTLKIKSPAAGKLIKSGDVEIKVEIKNWTLTSDGPHVHLIVDNEPYIAVRDASKPINVSALVRDNLHHELAEGTHVVRLFPGRARHESVKLAEAFATLVFHYKKKTEGFSFNATAPLLTYSRPKGCVVAGERVLLDFFVSNAELSATGPRVRYAIDSTVSGDILTWAPHFIENLPIGDHTLQLSLVDAEGNAIAGMFNDTTRTVTVAPNCDAPAPTAATPAETAPAAAPTTESAPTPATGTVAPAADAPK